MWHRVSRRFICLGNPTKVGGRERERERGRDGGRDGRGERDGDREIQKERNNYRKRTHGFDKEG